MNTKPPMVCSGCGTAYYVEADDIVCAAVGRGQRSRSQS